ncbi:MAG: DUF1003 domain-containing protein [Caulobacteraceae bacterium]
MPTPLSEHLSQTLLRKSYAELPTVQQQVIDAVAHEAPTGQSPELAPPPFWDQLADRVARVGGSWGFIFCFGVVLLGWMTLNSPLMQRFGVVFDPYPFIFLNLVLSTLAAIQAPIIMMSQNRAAATDRASAEHDYMVNLRAELEILRLHDRLDALEAGQLAQMLAFQADILARLPNGPRVEAATTPAHPS